MLPESEPLMSDTPVLYRDVIGAENLRTDAAGRTVFGIVVPFRQVSMIQEFGSEYPEMFIRGQFHQVDRRTRAQN